MRDRTLEYRDDQMAGSRSPSSSPWTWPGWCRSRSRSAFCSGPAPRRRSSPRTPRSACRRRDHAVVPEGADEVIDSLESAGIVLDASNNVLKASTGASRSVSSGTGARASRTRQARRPGASRGEPIADELHLSRGRSAKHPFMSSCASPDSARASCSCSPKTAPSRTASTRCAGTSSRTSATS